MAMTSFAPHRKHVRIIVRPKSGRYRPVHTNCSILVIAYLIIVAVCQFFDYCCCYVFIFLCLLVCRALLGVIKKKEC